MNFSKTLSLYGLLVITVIVGLLSGCTPIAPQSVTTAPGEENRTLTPITLGVGYIPNIQFTPFYVGIEKGFYAEEGLEITLDYGFENDYLKLVGVNELQFMIGSGDQVVLGRAQGLPVRYVMNWYTRYPVVVFAKASAGILTPADLAGKTIGIPGPFGANYVAFRGILEAAGLTENDVTAESIGFTQAAAVSADTVDAAVDYGVNGPVVLAQEGIATTQLTLDDHLQLPANGLVTNETTIAEDPALVQKMVRATLRATQYTLDNPDEAFAIALQFVPEAGGENEGANRAVFDAVLTYWTPAEGQQPGATDLAAWQSSAEFMQRIGLVDTLVPAEELFTNDFLP
ncbi:MAG TPA: ABC transporter substrate-binding protein [Caldilineaceae bacterium]|nr:ABC transporter substrate-binding protein [Caldilineaceae bacterium]